MLCNCEEKIAAIEAKLGMLRMAIDEMRRRTEIEKYAREVAIYINELQMKRD